MAGILLHSYPVHADVRYSQEAVSQLPTYDFKCTGCGRGFQVSRSMGSVAEELCPDCGASAKRVFTPVGVAFKGSGFHNTDYRSRPSEAAPAST